MRLRHLGAFLWLLVPGALVSIGLIVLPLAAALSLSFSDMETIVSPPRAVGLSNYADVLADKEFWTALKNGVVFATATVLLQMVLGLGFGIVLNKKFRGRAFLRGAVIVPYVIPTVAGVFIWRWLMDENVGLLTAAAHAAGLDASWFSDPSWAMATVIFISIWLWTPFVTVSVLAGLQTIPPHLYEAALVDGAGSFRRFWHITLPGLLPVLVVVGLLRGIWMFNKFDIIWLATGGGPLGATKHLPILAYEKAFQAFDISGGAAVATLNMAFVMIGVLIYIRLTRRWAGE